MERTGRRMGLGLDDAYVVLGVLPGASESEVKAAWRRLVSRWHPDRNRSADAAALMQRINRAYECLRLAFTDGSAAKSASADARDQRATGRVVRRRVRLSLEQAALGCVRVLRGKLTEACADCSGTGQLGAVTQCAECEGAGTVRSRLWFGWMSNREMCAPCEGSGTMPIRCVACEGRGRTDHRYEQSVRFPAGVRDGDVLTADGAGRHARGVDGTLEMQVELVRHPFFTMTDNGALRSEMPVNGFAWLAESWIAVPTLGGLQQMRLRRGRRVYRLRGQGWPLKHDGRERGDHVVTVVPTFPDAPNARQQALLEELAALDDVVDSDAMRAWETTLRAWERGRIKETA